jgi:hypothetical protein
MRTPLIRPLEKHIAVLNDLVWFHQFSQHEIGISRERLSPRAAQLMTGDFFGGNPFAARFNVAVGKMGDFGAKLETALHKLVLVDVYENFLEYIDKDIPELLAECGHGRWPGPSAKSFRSKFAPPESKFERLWVTSGYPPIDRHLWETFTYLRLRRHHYAHAAEMVSDRFTAHAHDTGARLNAYWGVKLRGAKFDFTSHEIFKPKSDEIIALIRVAQAWLRAMDAAVAGELVADQVLEFVARERLRAAGGKAFARNIITVTRLARGARADCQDQWGLTVKISAAEAAINAIDLAHL